MKTLAKHTSYYFLINLLSQTGVFVLWLIIANMLPPLEIGIYSLVIFVVSFFGAFSIFGLDITMTRFYYSEKENKSVLSNSIIIFVFSNVLSFLLLLMFSGMISLLIPGLRTILTKNIFLFYGLILTSSTYAFALAHYSALKQVKSFGQISILQTVLFFVLSIFFLMFNFRIFGIFYALLISYSIPSILFIINETKNISFGSFSIKTIRSVMQYGLPMMIYGVFGVFIMYVSRIFLDRYSNLSELGIYSFFLMIVLQINGIWSTINRAWTPEVFSKFKKNKESALQSVKTMAFFLSFLYLICVAGLIVLYRIGIFGLFLRKEYMSDINIFFVLLFGPLFMGIYTACYPLYFYGNKTKIILLISVILNLFNLILTFFLVRFLGQLGAALSFSIFSGANMLAFIFIFRKMAEIPKEIINWSFSIFFMAVITGFLFLKTSSYVLLLLFVIFGVILSYKIGGLKMSMLFEINE